MASVVPMKRTALATVFLVAALGLAGCSAPSASSGAYDLPAPAEVQPGDGGKVAEGAFQDGTNQSASDRSIITTGYLNITTYDPIEAAGDAALIVEQAGGRVDARQEIAAANGDRGSATLTLRIPSDTLTKTLAELKKMGDATELSLSSTDVTGQVQDLDARIDALRASVDRLTTLLATATDTTALVAIEASLSQRQSDLESMESQQRSLGDQVTMSTVTLNLVSIADAPVKKPVNFLTGLQTGWDSFVGFLSGLVVVIGVLLPWLIFFAIVTFIVIVLVRWRRSRRPAVAVPADAPLDPGFAAPVAKTRAKKS